MAPVVPPPFLFRFALPVPHVQDIPRHGPALLDLPAACTLPAPGLVGGATPFGLLRAAWNARGFGLSVAVGGKQRAPECRLDQPMEADGLTVWIDTRNTQSVHRATRFCHQFSLHPSGAGRKGDEPAVVQWPIARAREESPLDRARLVTIRSQSQPDGYRLEAWFPAEALIGFDAEASPRLGFYHHLHDRELGDQYLTVSSEFPFAHDPSLWTTLELVTP